MKFLLIPFAIIIFSSSIFSQETKLMSSKIILHDTLTKFNVDTYVETVEVIKKEVSLKEHLKSLKFSEKKMG